MLVSCRTDANVLQHGCECPSAVMRSFRRDADFLMRARGFSCRVGGIDLVGLIWETPMSEFVGNDGLLELSCSTVNEGHFENL